MRRVAGLNNGNGGNIYESLEHENDQIVDNLSTKVKALKSLSIEIGQEVKLHNSMLGDMDNQFDTTGSFLSQTMTKLLFVSKRGHHNVIWYLLLFCLFVFLITWLIVKFL